MSVAREVTQAQLDRLSAATLRHVPSQTYTVGDRLEERAAQQPGKAFIRFEEHVVPYGAANAAANRAAHAAWALGLRRGDVAALLMENRPEFVTTWMGLAKLGVTTALLNTQLRARALEHAIATAAPVLVVAGGECAEAIESLPADARRRWPIYATSGDDAPVAPPPGAGNWDALLARASTENLDRAVRDGLVAGDDLFFIYTSGTTGLPKAARLSHMRWLGVGDGMSAIAGYGPDDVIGCVLPLFHGAGGMVVVSSALAQGAAMFLARRFSASRFWDDARRHGMTGFQYVGEICRYLVNQPPRPDDRDHRVRVMMGAGLGRDVWEVFRDRFGIARILEGWSSTEANTSLINVDDRVGSCGRIPFPERHNGRLIRYDAERDEHPRDAGGRCIPCAPGEVGEFVGAIPDLPDSGAGRFEGYTDAAATSRKILRDVFQPGDRWYRSGDLLRCDEDGYYYFVDRIGDTYRWKSENVSTQEVAEALGGFPGLEIANVYGVAVPGAEGRAGMAALVLRDRAAFDGRAFWAWVAERLPGYAAPLFVRLSPEPDVTSTFKLRKLDLQRDGYDPSRTTDPLWVRDDAARAYVPLDAGALARLGIPPFAADAASSRRS
ncbi:MAG: long-chain-acyl-CoA synthetase [Proteobacteria bacterium]|nr:MAG: long-chain-acyl-CoA synthetase [Pseudomonadota bacterium]